MACHERTDELIFVNSFQNQIVGVRVLISVGVVPSSELVWLVVLGRVGQEWVPFVAGLVGGAGVILFEGGFQDCSMRF